jgi:hypothetical protein
MIERRLTEKMCGHPNETKIAILELPLKKVWSNGLREKRGGTLLDFLVDHLVMLRWDACKFLKFRVEPWWPCSLPNPETMKGEELVKISESAEACAAQNLCLSEIIETFL